MTMKNSHGDPTSGSAGDRGRLPRSNDPRSLYVITLFSSLMPMPLEVPDPRGLEGLAVFRSRRVEDGRERFRLHLGYFDSRTDAEDALPVVQKHFPSAWVASAPRSGLGSLDDTNLSEFRLIRSPTLLAMEIERRSSAATPPPQNTQRYVVQLSWADRRIDPSEVSQLAIFRAYALYTVTLARAGVRYYGIRLGFFTSAISARQVALYVREEFPEVAVVPISEREYTRAREMIAQREIRAIPEAASGPEPDIRAEPITTDASESAPVEASVFTEITDIATDDVPATEAAMESAALETAAVSAELETAAVSVAPDIATESVALETAGQSTAPETPAESVASEIAAESVAPEPQRNRRHPQSQLNRRHLESRRNRRPRHRRSRSPRCMSPKPPLGWPGALQPTPSRAKNCSER